MTVDQCRDNGSYGPYDLSRTGAFKGCRSELPNDQGEYWIPCLLKNQFPKDIEVQIGNKIETYDGIKGLAFDAFTQKCFCQPGWVEGTDDYDSQNGEYIGKNPDDGCICNPSQGSYKDDSGNIICGPKPE